MFQHGLFIQEGVLVGLTGEAFTERLTRRYTKYTRRKIRLRNIEEITKNDACKKYSTKGQANTRTNNRTNTIKRKA